MENQKTILDRRIEVLIWILGIIFIALSARLWQISVLQGEIFKEKSEANRVRIVELQAPRGIIYDRNGEVLAEDVPRFQIVFRPGSLSLEEAVSKLKVLFKDKIAINPKQRSANEWILCDNLNLEEVIRFEEARQELPGLSVETIPMRFYPHGEYVFHVVGYVGKVTPQEVEEGDYDIQDFSGKGGVELFYDKLLRGEKGFKKLEVDAKGRVLRVLENQPPHFRNSIALTLDLPFQEFCMNLLKDKKGVIIAGNPRTGAIFSLASSPTFDPNQLSKGMSQEAWEALSKDQSFPLTNRATQALYPPGSVFKLLVALAASEEIPDLDEKTFFCPGYFEYNDWKYPCWKRGGHGKISFEEAIAQSCNVVFYQLGLQLGIEKLEEYARLLGFGSPTGIDLPGEIGGFFPNPIWKRRQYGEPWYPGDTINLAIGQGYLMVTPLEIYRMICVLANRGVFCQPHLLDRIIDNQRGEILAFEPFQRKVASFKEETWRKVIDGMRLVVKQGTGRVCADLGIDLAAKTGTAQNPHGEDHSWFAGFFPADQPEFAFVVMIEHGGDGSGEAANTARAMIEWWLKNRRES
ncbi:MAG: penicillin-binding protein 2 [Candidatus Atribacteria bacterium]|nr:penicillin-binding protein 2 [Candidatus Atribacteria bacterium]